MFDIGFSEIVVIAVVALIVIGPERLPKTARTLGHLFGRLQRYVADVKADINREMELEELRKLQEQVQTAAHRLRVVDVRRGDARSRPSVRAVETELNAAAAGERAGADGRGAPRRRRNRRAAAAARRPRMRRGRRRCRASTVADAHAPRQASLPGFDAADARCRDERPDSAAGRPAGNLPLAPDRAAHAARARDRRRRRRAALPVPVGEGHLRRCSRRRCCTRCRRARR